MQKKKYLIIIGVLVLIIFFLFGIDYYIKIQKEKVNNLNIQSFVSRDLTSFEEYYLSNEEKEIINFENILLKYDNIKDEKSYYDGIKEYLEKLNMNSPLIQKYIISKKENILEKSKEKDVGYVLEHKDGKISLSINNKTDFINNLDYELLKKIRLELIKIISSNGYRKWNKEITFSIKEVDTKNNKVILKEQEKKESKDKIIELLENNLKKTDINEISNDIKKEYIALLLRYKFPSYKISGLENVMNIENIDFILDNSDFSVLLEEGYLDITSYRERRNVDRYYRLYNIETAFKNIGNLILLPPEETYSHLKSIDYDEFSGSKHYLWGATIVNGEEKQTYGGGLCGSSTAIYQGILTNKGLKIDSTRNHSWWSNKLYEANISGEVIKTPGLDSTIYAINKKLEGTDLKFTNITNEPIYLYANIIEKDGKKYEQVVTISNIKNKGKIEFISRKNQCYTWNVNGEEVTSCYVKVLN